MNKILIIDEDVVARRALAEFLVSQGFLVDLAPNRKDDVMEKALQGAYSLIILDIMSPLSKGYKLLSHLRLSADIPIIILTLRNSDTDRIVGLEMGADDYLSKTCNHREILARIRSLLRRTKLSADDQPRQGVPPVMKVGDVELDSASRRVTCSGSPLELTSLEFTILEILLRSAGQIVGKKELVQTATGRPLSRDDRRIDMHISNIRKKLREYLRGDWIKTVRGKGYQYIFTQPHGGEGR